MHREMFSIPSDVICVDESMSCWYELGGDWLDVGLPTYRAIYSKPENGCEIKISACGRSGIMLRLIVVKSPNEYIEYDTNAGLNHGAATTRRLVESWKYSNRIVRGDSYFASIATVQELQRLGMRFICVVKTAHRNFPSKYLGSLTMEARGKWFSMIHEVNEGECKIGAVL